MFFVGLAIFGFTAWCLPWWATAAAAFALGALVDGILRAYRATFTLSFAAGLVWAALAYVQDGRMVGLVSRRLGGLFSLPHPMWMFAVMMVIGFVTVFLGLRSGLAARGLLNAVTNSPNSAS